MSESVIEQAIDIQGVSDPSWVSVGGVDVAYRRAGSGAPLLFMHGMGLANSWMHSHAGLAEKFEVIAPQLPGFGRSVRPAWFRSLDDAVVLYADVLDALGVERTHVVGHSLGGLLAGAFASTYPERVLSLTIVAPLLLPVLRPEFEGDHDGDAPANIMELLFNEDYQSYSEYDPPADLGLLVGEADDEFSDPSAFKLAPAPGLYRRLARITAPRQLLVPDNDQVVPAVSVTDWARWLDAPVVKISGRTASTGHMLTEQEPQQYIEAVAALAARASS